MEYEVCPGYGKYPKDTKYKRIGSMSIADRMQCAYCGKWLAATVSEVIRKHKALKEGS